MLFSDESICFIDRVSMIRSDWSKKQGWKEAGDNVPQWVLDAIGPHFMLDVVSLLKNSVSIVQENGKVISQ